jgi:hypothetical protein
MSLKYTFVVRTIDLILFDVLLRLGLPSDVYERLLASPKVV